MKTKTICARVPASIAMRMERHSDETGKSLGEIVREGVLALLDVQDESARLAAMEARIIAALGRKIDDLVAESV